MPRRFGDSNATAAYGQRQRLLPQRVELGRPPWEVPEEPVLPDSEAARDERRLDGARPGEHGHLDSCAERGLDETTAGVVDARQTCVGDERERLAGPEARQEVARLARLVVAVDADEAACANPVPIEQHLRAARVLAEHEVGVAERVEHTMRHVREVSDRRRADEERHRLAQPVKRLEAD